MPNGALVDPDVADLAARLIDEAAVVGRAEGADLPDDIESFGISPDGSTFFVNMQVDGWTVAITGPWGTEPRL